MVSIVLNVNWGYPLNFNIITSVVKLMYIDFTLHMSKPPFLTI